MKKTPVTDQLSTVAAETLDQLQAVNQNLEQTIEQAATPLRKQVFARFPALFLLLVTIGVVATFLGLEQMLLQYAFLREQPWVLFIAGIFLLVVTGTLYKKLG